MAHEVRQLGTHDAPRRLGGVLGAYLHLVDTSRRPQLRHRRALERRQGRPELEVATKSVDFEDSNELSHAWVPLTIALKQLEPPAWACGLYPFVIPELGWKKIRFVHEVIAKVPRGVGAKAA